MSSGEMIGIVLTAALGGAVVGALATSVAALGRDRGARRERLLDAYAGWLAARRSLTRSTASFIAAFRALAQEPPESRFLRLRREEAQRSRADWCEAARDLDRAEATLLTRAGTPRMADDLQRFPRIHPDAIRDAINGTQRDVDQLLRRARDVDRQTTEFVLGATAILRRPPSTLTRSWHDVVRFAGAIVDRWAQAPGASPRKRGPRA